MPRVLIIGKDPGALAQLESSIGGAGYDAIKATYSARSISKKYIESLAPNLLLIDRSILQHEKDAKTIKRIFRETDIPIVLFGNRPLEDVSEKDAFDYAYGYITAPFKPEEIAAAVKTALSKYNAKRSLTQIEKDLLVLAENLNDGVLGIREGVILYANPKFSAVIGYPPEEIIDRPLLTFVHPDDKQSASEIYLETMARKKPSEKAGVRFIDHTGNTKFIDLKRVPIVWRGEPLLLILATDITGVRQTEDALRQSQLRYKTLFESASDVIFTVNRNGDFLSVNGTGARDLGSTPSEIVGKNIYDVFPRKTAAFKLRGLRKVFREGTPFFMIDTVLSILGQNKWFNTTLVPIKDHQNQTECVLGISRDITERKKMEEALQESERKYRTVVENAQETILIIQDEIVKYCNPTTFTLSGYTMDDLRSRPFIEFIHPDDRPDVIKRYLHEMKGGDSVTPHTYRVFRKDESIRWVEGIGVAIQWEGRPASLSFVNDITKRKHIEQVLYERDRQLLYFFDNLTDIAYMADTRGYITYLNKTAENISETRLQDIVGTSPKTTIFSEESREIALDAFQAVIKGESIDCDLTFFNGKTFHFINNPLKDEYGNIIGVFGIGRDITELKKVEEGLAQNDQKQSAILNSMYERIDFLDMDMRIVWANVAQCASIGLNLGDIKGNHCFELFQRKNIPCENCPAAKALETGAIQQAEIAYLDGKTWLIRAYPVRNDRRNVIGVTIKSVDIGQLVKERERLSHFISIGKSVTKDGGLFSAPLNSDYIYPFHLFIDYQHDEFVILLRWKELNKEWNLSRLVKSETATIRFIFLASRMKAGGPEWVDKDIIKPGKADINLNALRKLLEESRIPWCDKISARMLIRSSKDESKKIRLAIKPENIEITENIKKYKSKKYKYLETINEKIREFEEKLKESTGDKEYIKDELRIQKVNKINILKNIETVEFLTHETIKALNYR